MSKHRIRDISNIKPIDVSEEYLRRERARIKLTRLEVEEESLHNKVLAMMPYYVLKYGEDALYKAETFLRNDLSLNFPLMGLLFKGLRAGLGYLKKRASVK